MKNALFQHERRSTLKPPIGIFGGTFDPIHNGHLKIAEEVLRACKLKEIRFIPSYIPVHRTNPNASSEDRYEMLKLALENRPRFTIDDCEYARKKPSYMIDTLYHLQKNFPQTPLCLILGQDAFLYLHQWHKWRHIIENANLIIVNRHTYTEILPDELAALLKESETKKVVDLHTHLSGKIYQLQIEPIPISASHIRYELQHGKKLNDQLPENVYQYILEKKLYQEST